MNSKYKIGDILYNKFTNKHYLIRGIVDVGGTECYDFLVLTPCAYSNVEVAVSIVDNDNYDDYSLVA